MCLISNQSEITYQNTYYLSACVVILVLFKVDYIAAYGASVKMYFDIFNFGSRNFIETFNKKIIPKFVFGCHFKSTANHTLCIK